MADVFTTETLLGLTQQVDKPVGLFLDLFFPQEVLFETEEIIYDQLDADYKLAPFVLPTSQGKVIADRGQEARIFKPAYVKPKSVVSPAKALTRAAGESFQAPLSLQARIDLQVMRILEQHAIRHTRRQEWMAAQAMLTGTVTVSGEDYPTVVVDFQRDASLTKTLVGPALWSAGTADPLTNIEDWAAEMESPVTDIAMSQESYRAALNSDKFVKSLNRDFMGNTSSLDMGPGNGESRRLVGILSGTMRVWVYTAIYTDDAGAEQKFLPSDKVVLGSADAKGVRAFGAIQDHDFLQAATVWPKMWKEDDPSVMYLMTQSAPLMIPQRPNATLAATVL